MNRRPTLPPKSQSSGRDDNEQDLLAPDDFPTAPMNQGKGVAMDTTEMRKIIALSMEDVKESINAQRENVKTLESDIDKLKKDIKKLPDRIKKDLEKSGVGGSK